MIDDDEGISHRNTSLKMRTGLGFCHYFPRRTYHGRSQPRQKQK
jgi:hypothetical protein